MATVGFGQREAKRKKLVTALVTGTLAATALAVGVAYWVRVARKDQPLPISQSLPTNIHQQLSGYTFTRSDAGRQVFTVHAARTVAFKQGGTTVLEDVTVEVFGQSGTRRDVLRTRRCDYNAESGDLFSSGPVQIELNSQASAHPEAGLRSKQPVELETSKVAFLHQGSRVVSEEPVRFRIGPASGTAHGMEYATKEDWLELKQDVVMELQPPGGPVAQPSLHLSASRLRYDKIRGQVTLWGPLEVRQGTRRAVAQRGTISLDEHDRITRGEVEGGVEAFDSSEGHALELAAQRARGDFDPASGQLRQLVAEIEVRGKSEGRKSVSHLAAQYLKLNFTGAHAKPQSGIVSGNVHLNVESSPVLTQGVSTANKANVELKDFRAAQVKFDFRSDGKSIRNMETAGPGTLIVIPADPKVGQRVITAGQFVMAFDTRNRLESLRGLRPTRIVFRPPDHAPPGSIAQESSAELLEATFDPATETLREVEQTGDFQFRDGDRQASAQAARYLAPTQSLHLMGHPQIWDAQSRVKAERLNFDLRNDTAEGGGNVQGTHLQSGKQVQIARPANPTNVLADRMVAQRRSQVMHYEGHVRAWHGADVVESSALDVYRAQRRMSSGSQVVTSHLQPASLASGMTAASGGPHKETRPATVRADLLEYFDQGRKASYRGHVRLQTENTTLEADRMDVYFLATETGEESEIERAVADGGVRVTQPGRHANGEHAEYFAEPGKIEVTGGPPALYDTERGFTTGQRLTFFVRDDRLVVDGGDKSPSLSKHRVAQ